MPSMASITVKKNDGVTDQVWTAVQASGGDKSPAIWRNQSVGVAPAYQPEMTMTSKPNGDGTVRRIQGQVAWKQSATGPDGITRNVNVGYTKFEHVVPQGMTTAELNEFASQSSGLLGSPLMKQIIKDGFAPQ